MKLFFLILFSLSSKVFAASCCVSNTGVSNLMILPSQWQQTVSIGQSRVIGDVDTKGDSTFRNNKNKDTITYGRFDLGYSWSHRYQTGISLRYQERNREFYGSEAKNTNWNDLGFSHAYQFDPLERIWIYQSVNVPTAKSPYDSKARLNVDAHGTGMYQTNIGLFHIQNFKEWDLIINPDISRSFSRTFDSGPEELEVKGFWGAGLFVGGGYIPWRSKMRFGAGINPRYTGKKVVYRQGNKDSALDSFVWDTSLNATYSIDAQYAVGLNYVDQTIFGPAKNTVLNRSLILLLQSRWM